MKMLNTMVRQKILIFSVDNRCITVTILPGAGWYFRLGKTKITGILSNIIITNTRK